MFNITIFCNIYCFSFVVFNNCASVCIINYIPVIFSIAYCYIYIINNFIYFIIFYNNTNETITYRLVIEKSERTNLDIEYIRYQLSVGNTYIEPKRLDAEIWNTDAVSEQLNVKGTNYILLEKTLEPLATDEIKLMLWTDYETIPNSMQDKYFYGTLKIYAYQEINKNV